MRKENILKQFMPLKTCELVKNLKLKNFTKLEKIQENEYSESGKNDGL